MSTRTIHLCLVNAPALRAALEAGEPLSPDALALDRLDLTDASDLLSDGDGWLPRLSSLAGAPLTLDHFERAPRQAAGVKGTERVWELDTFALCAVYERVVWDDRAPGWHNEIGQPNAHNLLRKLHDLALRAYRNHDDERLVMLEPC